MEIDIKSKIVAPAASTPLPQVPTLLQQVHLTIQRRTLLPAAALGVTPISKSTAITGSAKAVRGGLAATRHVAAVAAGAT